MFWGNEEEQIPRHCQRRCAVRIDIIARINPAQYLPAQEPVLPLPSAQVRKLPRVNMIMLQRRSGIPVFGSSNHGARSVYGSDNNDGVARCDESSANTSASPSGALVLIEDDREVGGQLEEAAHVADDARVSVQHQQRVPVSQAPSAQLDPVQRIPTDVPAMPMSLLRGALLHLCTPLASTRPLPTPCDVSIWQMLA